MRSFTDMTFKILNGKNDEDIAIVGLVLCEYYKLACNL